MTHQILQSDIDFAARLLREGTPDSEIIAALGLRGIAPESALNLLVELRSGKRISPELNIVRPASTNPSPHVQVKRHKSSKQKPSASAAWDRLRDHRKPRKFLGRDAVVFVSLLCILVPLGTVAVFTHRYHKRTEVLLSQAEGNLFDIEMTRRANSSGSQAVSANSQSLDQAQVLLNEAAGRRLSAAEKADLLSLSNRLEAFSLPRQKEVASELALELRDGGLHMGQFCLNPGNSLDALEHFLGTPTRTNQIEQTDRTIKAYDSSGLLVYSQKDGLIDSVVLDFSGLGGTYGCTNPFRGVLKVEDNVIGADTQPKALAAIRPLGLTNIADGEVFVGSYSNLTLSFAYLKPPDARLSIVVIDFK